MTSDRGHEGIAPSETTGGMPARPEPTRMSRRRALGSMSAVATAGAAAWMVPEILTAKPAAGAPLSGATEASTVSNPDPAPAATSSTTSSGPGGGVVATLASTGFDLQRDAEIGAALIAGGWAMHHWASRPTGTGAKGPGSLPGTESPTPAS